MAARRTRGSDPSESPLLSQLDLGKTSRSLNVRVSYEIIKLFSEGLYGSPHKAVEELVSNSYDAAARNVHVLMPRPEVPMDSLWVIDDGCGMDEQGFDNLWRIAYSPKTEPPPETERLPIGQFGIGKLAAYVLAWRLTHVSKVDDRYLFTSMNFHLLEEHHQWEAGEKPIAIDLRVLEEQEAQALLCEIEQRDSKAWELLFGKRCARTWTAAALTEFRDLADKLQEGTLSWVLRTGLPLLTDFSIFLNGNKLESAKIHWQTMLTLPVGGKDPQAEKLGIRTTKNGITIAGIGPISGEARLYERPLAGGKSDQYNRSRGFFIHVRKRVINLEDELFGLDVLNHAAWAHFMMEVEADGLRAYLLSSREGVRDTGPVRLLRRYLHEKFNACRRHFDAVRFEQLVGLDIEQLLSDTPSSLVTGSLVDALDLEVHEQGRQLYYISVPEHLDQDTDQWVQQFERDVAVRPFTDLEVLPEGPYAPLARYDATTRKLLINDEHPFIVKLKSNSKNQAPMTLFATSEILTDALIRRFNPDPATALAFFETRDRVLRLIAGEPPPTATDVLRWLDIADQDDTAMERAVGAAFGVLGFHYEKRGGRGPGTDGVLSARLGRQGPGLADYKLVFDAKTTNSPRIPATKVDFAALHAFKDDENASFGFAVGKAFQGEDDPNSMINREANAEHISVLRTQDLRRIVELHIRHGVTLPKLRQLFDSSYSVIDTRAWVNSLDTELQEAELHVPVREFLEGIEELKKDEKGAPTVSAVRQTVPSLKAFEFEKLEAVLRGIQAMVGSRWLELDELKGIVHLNQSPDIIIAEVQRLLFDSGSH